MRDRKALLMVKPLDWKSAREKERETDTHPCDAWNPNSCMCKGACSCHWAQVPEEYAQAINTLRSLVSDFYWLCFQRGVGSTAHAFLEFNGVMKTYVDMLENAVHAGLNPQELNKHGGKPVPVMSYEVEYLAEKLDCIFGPILVSNKEARKILLSKLFGITE